MQAPASLCIPRQLKLPRLKLISSSTGDDACFALALYSSVSSLEIVCETMLQVVLPLPEKSCCFFGGGATDKEES